MSGIRLHITAPRWTERISLEADERHRLLQVLRLTEGDRLEVFDGQGRSASALLGGDGEGTWWLELDADLRQEAGTRRVVLAVAMPKGRKLDDVVRQCTEIGVSEIRPFLSRRSVARPERARAAKRLERWRSIASEASRQSGRSRLPDVHAMVDFEDLLGWLDDEGECLAGRVFHEKASPCSPGQLWTPEELHRLVLCGPEGGFTEEEVLACTERGVRAVRVGWTVMRAETAAVVSSALAVLTGGLGSDNP